MDYTELLSTSKELIKTFGKIITLLKYNQTPTDSDKPWAGNILPTTTPSFSFNLYGVLIPISSKTSLGALSSNTDLSYNRNNTYIVEPSEQTPDILQDATILIDSGIEYKIKSIDKLKPANTVLLYYVEVSR